MTKRDHTTAPPVWQATIPAMSDAPTPTPHAETEPLTARFERLRKDYMAENPFRSDYSQARHLYCCTLMNADEAGQLIALDVPANGEPARTWLDGGVSGMGSWNAIRASDTGVPQHPYIAQSALRSALRAERVAGMREAAGIADGLLMRSRYLTKSGGELPVYAEDVSIAIRAAADKMEAGK